MHNETIVREDDFAESRNSELGDRQMSSYPPEFARNRDFHLISPDLSW